MYITTDGDRALFIAHALGVRRAVLGGMNFSGPVGRYSLIGRPKDIGIKLKKLEIAKMFISKLISKGMEILSLSETGIENVRSVNPRSV